MSARTAARRRSGAAQGPVDPGEAAPTQLPDKDQVECAAPDCDVRFTPKRSTARFHSATCRQRAGRARKAAEAAAAIDEKAEAETGPTAEHGLVRATRLELEKATALETVDGQIALQLARKLVDPEHVSPGLAKELRATLAAAKGAAAVPAGDESASSSAEPEETDEVKRARVNRERKAREAAAGRA